MLEANVFNQFLSTVTTSYAFCYRNSQVMTSPNWHRNWCEDSTSWFLDWVLKIWRKYRWPVMMYWKLWAASLIGVKIRYNILCIYDDVLIDIGRWVMFWGEKYTHKDWKHLLIMLTPKGDWIGFEFNRVERRW